MLKSKIQFFHLINHYKIEFYHQLSIKMKNNVPVNFQVESTTSFAQDIYIVGNIFQLSNWDISKGLKLSCFNHASCFIWKNLKPIHIEIDTALEFKVIVKDKQGQFIKWESINGNRCVSVKSSILISCFQGNPQIKVQQIPQPLIIPCRNKTFDILNDLSDMVSSSSSGNERQFWFLANMKRDKKITQNKRIELFVNQASKFINIQHNKSPNINCEINNSVILLERQYTHILIRDQPKDIKDGEEETSISDENSMKKSQIVFLHYGHISHIISKKDINDVRQKQKSYICFNPQNQEEYQNMRNREIILDSCQIIIIRKLQNLNILLSSAVLKGFSVQIIKEKYFKVLKDQKKISLIIFQPELACFNSLSIAKNANFFNKIDKLAIKYNISLEKPEKPQPLNSQFLQRLRGKKILLLISCKNLNKMDQKIITTLLRISESSIVQIYILTEENKNRIHKKFPISEDEKVFVMNKEGDLNFPDNKIANLFDQLDIRKDQYHDFITLFQMKLATWAKLDGGLLTIQQHENSLKVKIEPNIIGKSIADYIDKEIQKHNQNHPKIQFSYSYQNYSTHYVVKIKPYVGSELFYCQTINQLAKKQNGEDFFYFTFDMEQCQLQHEKLESIMEGLDKQMRNNVKGFGIQNSLQGEKKMIEILEVMENSLGQGSVFSDLDGSPLKMPKILGMGRRIWQKNGTESL